MKVLAIVGTYRKSGIIDRTIDEILASAQEKGAQIEKIYLVDQHIEFCTNCRTCTQQDGVQGNCIINDDVHAILDAVDKADALVLGSPMNFGTVTAVMKKFIERLVCFAYWPWGATAPKVRNRKKPKYAVVVASAAAPAFMARFSSGMVKLLKSAAELLGARTIGVIFIGRAAVEREQGLGKRTRKKARMLGARLAAFNSPTPGR